MVNNKQRAEMAKQLASKLPFSIKQVYNTLEQADLLSVDWESLDLVNYPERWHYLVRNCLAVSETRCNPSIKPTSSAYDAWGKLITGQDPDLPAEPEVTLKKLLELHELNVRTQEAMTARISALSQEVAALKRRGDQAKGAPELHLPFKVEYRAEGDAHVDGGTFEVEGMMALLQQVYSTSSRNRGSTVKFEVYHRGRWVTSFKYNGAGSLQELGAAGRYIRNMAVWKSRSEL